MCTCIIQIKKPSNRHGGFQHSTHLAALHFGLQQVYICVATVVYYELTHLLPDDSDNEDLGKSYYFMLMHRFNLFIAPNHSNHW